jgi:hypothetical protein
MDFTKEELVVIQKAILGYRVHGCNFNGEEYHTSCSVLDKVFSKIYAKTDK